MCLFPVPIKSLKLSLHYLALAGMRFNYYSDYYTMIIPILTPSAHVLESTTASLMSLLIMMLLSLAGERTQPAAPAGKLTAGCSTASSQEVKGQSVQRFTADSDVVNTGCNLTNTVTNAVSRYMRWWPSSEEGPL